MNPRIAHCIFASCTLFAAASFAADALPVSAGFGPNPTLPEPKHSVLPTIDIAPAKGWSAGATPKAANGFAVTAVVSGLDHPRWIYVLPNGDILVAETAAPERPEEGKGVKGKAMTEVMKKAGSAVPSANRIT